MNADAWYAGTPYASNQPLTLSLSEQNDVEYYQTIDNYMKKKNASRCANAYPRAPDGKPSINNFYNVNQIKKRHEMMHNNTNMSSHCRGACIKRYLKTKNENLIPYNAYHNYQYKSGEMAPMGGQQARNENSIPYNAYHNYQHKSGKMTPMGGGNYRNENLIPYNAYHNYQYSGKMTPVGGLIKKKNT